MPTPYPTGYCLDCQAEVAEADRGICSHCHTPMDSSLVPPLPWGEAVASYAQILAAMAPVRRSATDEKAADS